MKKKIAAIALSLATAVGATFGVCGCNIFGSSGNNSSGGGNTSGSGSGGNTQTPANKKVTRQEWIDAFDATFEALIDTKNVTLQYEGYAPGIYSDSGNDGRVELKYVLKLDAKNKKAQIEYEAKYFDKNDKLIEEYTTYAYTDNNVSYRKKGYTDDYGHWQKITCEDFDYAFEESNSSMHEYDFTLSIINLRWFYSMFEYDVKTKEYVLTRDFYEGFDSVSELKDYVRNMKEWEDCENFEEVWRKYLLYEDLFDAYRNVTIADGRVESVKLFAFEDDYADINITFSNYGTTKVSVPQNVIKEANDNANLG